MRKVKAMNFGWEYSESFQESYVTGGSGEFALVDIPHSNKELPYNNFDEKLYQFESCYRKRFFALKEDTPVSEEHSELFTISSPQNDDRVILHFEGVMVYAKVYLNGVLLASHKGGYTPFEVDITEHIRWGFENLLVVSVDSKERPEIPPFGFVVDYLTYGGIYREVWLEERPVAHIKNMLVKTSHVMDTQKQVALDLYLKGFDANEMISIQATIKDAHGKDIYRETQHVEVPVTMTPFSGVNIDLGSRVTMEFSVSDVLLWDIDTPNLYHIEVSLLRRDSCIDSFTQRFGFREVSLTEDGFFLNKKQIKIRGLNRHQSFPYVGYAMPKSAQVKDADILKYELGLNAVRLSHYPQSDHFLNRCDEIGLLVFDEIPGWQHIGEKGEWWNITKQHVVEMLHKDWNHPSIFIWGVRINESPDCDELYKETNAIAHALDSSRPTGGVRCFEKSNLFEDVYTYNDFVHNGSNEGLKPLKKVAKKGKNGKLPPYLVTEYNGHMFPTKKFDPTDHRIEHALRHTRVLNAMYKDQDISGCFGWCMVDYNTHKEFGSGDKICYHGVMDMFRIPKYAAAVYSSMQDTTPVLEVASSMANGDLPGSVRGPVYIFTNCDEVQLHMNDEYIGTFHPHKEAFPALPHPPVLINDFVGNRIAEHESFSKKDAARIKKILTKIDVQGDDSLSIKDYLIMGYLMLKYKMNMQDASDLYTTYFGGWGSASMEYRFDGYKGGEKVISKQKVQILEPKLEVSVDSDTLIEEDTYDVTRVVVRLVDHCGEDIQFAHDAIGVETSGPLAIIGPAQLSLIGGSVAFWVRTCGSEGTGEVLIRSDRFGDIVKSIHIEKR